MGRKLKMKAQRDRGILQSKRGIVHQFLVQRNNGISFTDAALESILETMIVLIEKRQAISDDMLLLVWRYELSKECKKNLNKECNPLKTRLWKVIESCLTQVLKIPPNKKDLAWFQTYLFNSAVK